MFRSGEQRTNALQFLQIFRKRGSLRASIPNILPIHTFFIIAFSYRRYSLFLLLPERMPPSYLHLRLSRNDRPKRGSWRFEYAKGTGQSSRIHAVERTREASDSLSSIPNEVRQALNRLCEVRRCLEVGGKSEDEGVAVPAVYLAEFGDVALKRGWGTGKDGA